MGLLVVTAAERHPVNVPEMKRWQRSTDTDWEDDEVAETLDAAVDYVQRQTDRQCVSATYELQYVDWPIDRHTRLPGFRLPRAPAQAEPAPEIKYLDPESVWQTLDPATYQFDHAVEPALIRPVQGATWPSVKTDELVAVTVEWVAGFGDAAEATPADLKIAIRQYATYLFESREAECPIPMAFRETVRNWKVRGADRGGDARDWRRPD